MAQRESVLISPVQPISRLEFSDLRSGFPNCCDVLESIRAVFRLSFC
jgi:hypothetical protein